jgi:VWFA-related protein
MPPQGRPASLRVLIVAAIALAGTVALHSQQIPQPPQPPTPTFRAGVELVQVDVFVTDEDGRPVRGLTQDDFEVFERRQPQTITTFAAVDIPPSPGLRVETDVEPDVMTNDVQDARVYLFALDGAGAANALRARAFLRGFLDRHFRENDMAAVVTGQGLATDGHDFTHNRRLLLTAINKYSGGAADLRDLRDRVEFLARMPGARKAVLWITEGVAFDSYDIVDYQGGVLSRMNEYAHGIISAATRGNIRIYPINPAALDPFALGPGHLEQRAKFFAVGEVTGGFGLIDSNNFAGAFERLIQETSTYYILGYESSAERRPGRYTEFDVRVKRPGLKVKARPGYVEELDYLQRKRKPEPEQPRVAAALGAPVSISGLPMRVVATPFRKSGGTAHVAVTVDLAGSGLTFVQKGNQYSASIELRHLATDARNKLHPEFRHVASVSLPEAEYQRVLASGVRVISQFELPSGRYQLRVASVSGAESGSVVHDLEVPDFRKDALAMSGVALADSSAGGVLILQADATGAATRGTSCRPPVCVAEVRPTKEMRRWPAPGGALVWQDQLTAPPTTVRTFAPDQTLSALFEVYDNKKTSAKDAPHSIEVTLTLRTADGQVVRTLSQQRSSRSDKRASGGHAFVLDIPLTGVSEGPHVVQVDARTDRNPTAVVSRRIPIRVN